MGLKLFNAILDLLCVYELFGMFLQHEQKPFNFILYLERCDVVEGNGTTFERT